MKKSKIILAGTLACTFFFALLVWNAGTSLIAPRNQEIPLPPASLGATEVSFHSESDSVIAGWLIPGVSGKGAILLLHGIGANRMATLRRAEFLHARGFTVLAIDLSAHGRSTGDVITFGYREAHDVEAAVAYLAQHANGEKIGAIGVSLGGAALLSARPATPLSAIAIESVYSTIETASENRLRARFGAAGNYLKYLLLWQLQLRLGIDPAKMRPIERLSSIKIPIFIASGVEDLHTTLAESEAMCAHANQPKVCWFVPGAAHVDLHSFVRAEYEARIGEFFRQYLQSSSSEANVAHS